MNTPLLLTNYERCDRCGFWSRSRERVKLDDTEMLQQAIRAGVTEAARSDWGEVAGEEAYGLGNEPGLETTHYDVHAEVVHLACIADAITTAIRKSSDKPWQLAGRVQLGDGPVWTSGAYIDPSGLKLRRIVLVSAWNNDRHYSECRSWFSLGEICAFGLPMQMAVVVLGQRRDGKRHSPWAKGLRHPANKKLRFRKKHDVASGFKDTWRPVWREDFDDIGTNDWLQAMLDDGVLEDVCFPVTIDIPEKAARQRIVEMAARKLERLAAMKTVPDPQLTGCDWPKPCIFRRPCHGGREPQKGPFRILE
jgi:hypothetical protein